MTHMDMGVTGAKRQTWRRANPRDLLRRVVEENPKASNDELFKRFNKLVDGAADDILETIKRYYFDNNVRSLLAPDSLPARDLAAREVLRATVADTVKDKIEEKAKILLLEAIMPNGKPLRECTGRECRSMGGWLSEIGSKLKPSEVVGHKFSEDQVQSHWRRKCGPIDSVQ